MPDITHTDDAALLVLIIVMQIYIIKNIFIDTADTIETSNNISKIVTSE